MYREKIFDFFGHFLDAFAVFRFRDLKHRVQSTLFHILVVGDLKGAVSKLFYDHCAKHHIRQVLGPAVSPCGCCESMQNGACLQAQRNSVQALQVLQNDQK